MISAVVILCLGCLLADLIRPIIPQLNGIVREADEIRNGPSKGLKVAA